MTTAPATTPIDDHALRRGDGRRVAWSEWGTSDGSPVLLLHRNPGSRLFDPDPEATKAAGVRLITLDRPGYGGTDPVADPTPAAVASDLAEVIDEAHLDLPALVGWSGGGMFAIEAAALLGGRIQSLSLVCTPAPNDEIPWIPDDFRSLAESARSDPAGALESLTQACSFYAGGSRSARRLGPEPGRRGRQIAPRRLRRARRDDARGRPPGCDRNGRKAYSLKTVSK